MKAAWKMEGIYKADATKVASEIESLGERYSLSDVVEKAKDESSEMHSCFEWDDAVAGHKYRLSQAGNMVRQLVIVREEKDKEKKTDIRMFVSTGEKNNTYAPTKLVVRRQDEYEALLERAKSELSAFKKKYRILSELEEIFEAIEGL